MRRANSGMLKGNTLGRTVSVHSLQQREGEGRL
jgi:hypothetical protein